MLPSTETLYKKILSLMDSGSLAGDEITVERDFPLKTLCSFKTGGNADLALFPKTERALCAAVSAARECSGSYYVLGNGTNVLVPDEGYRGAVIVTAGMKKISFDGLTVTALCGDSVTFLAARAGAEGLTGLEFAYGIPGSVGGGIFMNAGAYDGEMKNAVKSVRALMPDGSIREFSNAECEFGYRRSIFAENGAVVLSAAFELAHGDKAEIKARMDDLMNRRRTKQPLEYPSAGSTFKRYPGRYTGQMIEQCGLKGCRIGGAMVSEKHAGFIINYDNATTEDILALIDKVKSVILEKEGVPIECEVRLLK